MTMKILSIQIQKFRSIDNMKISLGQIMAIVGANNTGKSHILRALNAFFNFDDEKEFFTNQDHAFTLKSRPKITICMENILPSDGVDPRYIYNDKLLVRLTYRWDRKNPYYDVIVNNISIPISIEEFGTIFEKFRYIYVPVVRNYDEAIMGTSGIANRLLNAVLERQIANRNTIQSFVDRLASKIKSTVFLNAVSDIKKYYPLDMIDFTVETTGFDVVRAILSNASLHLIEKSQKHEINNCGSGIQSAFYFAISMALAMEEGINFLVGIEEPELNMHPQAQRQLIDTLKDTTRYPKTQFMLTTHSTVIIDKLGHSSILLCKKIRGTSRDIVTEGTQIPNDFFQAYQMTEERYANFYQYKNSDFFFSNYIIMAESSIDCNVITDLLLKYGINIEEKAISILPMDGERNIKYPYSLAKELKIPFLCIVDRDVFQPYINNDRKNSLGEDGIPLYRDEKKDSSPIFDIINETDANDIICLFKEGKYNDVLEKLKEYKIISMRYALEVDLVQTPYYCNAICDLLHLPAAQRNMTHLLKDRSKQIKDYNIISSALNSGTWANLPKSYKQIISYVRNMINID